MSFLTEGPVSFIQKIPAGKLSICHQATNFSTRWRFASRCERWRNCHPAARLAHRFFEAWGAKHAKQGNLEAWGEKKMIPGDAGKEVFHKTPNGKVRYFCGMLVGEETKEVGEMSIVKLVALTPPHTKKTQSPQKFETWKTCSFVDFLLISPAFLAIFFFPHCLSTRISRKNPGTQQQHVARGVAGPISSVWAGVTSRGWTCRK